MSLSLKGRVTLVTGAADGIGRAVALQCAREGAAVLVSDRDAAGAQATAEQLKALGASVLVVTADVGRSGDIQHLVERCCAHFGRLDVACNITGASEVHGLRYQIEAMQRTGGGSVVNVTQAAHAPRPPENRHDGHRRTSRQQLRDAIHHHAAAGVRINTVAAGLIGSSRTPTLFSPTANVQADRVAELVVWLASDRAGYVSGAFYPVESVDPARV